MTQINEKIHVFTDFDGTITLHDSLEAILDHFTGTDWRKIEEQVTLGRLTEKTSLQAEFNLLKVPLEAVLTFLDDTIEIDQSFNVFVDYCSQKNINLTILSGGIDIFIERILTKYGLQHIEFFSNSIIVKSGNQWQIVPSKLPKIKNNCNHCKTNHIVQAKNAGFKTIYIGDGNTDRCAATHSDMIFARDSLKKYLSENKMEFTAFNKFSDIVEYLEAKCCN